MSAEYSSISQPQDIGKESFTDVSFGSATEGPGIHALTPEQRAAGPRPQIGQEYYDTLDEIRDSGPAVMRLAGKGLGKVTSRIADSEMAGLINAMVSPRPTSENDGPRGWEGIKQTLRDDVVGSIPSMPTAEELKAFPGKVIGAAKIAAVDLGHRTIHGSDEEKEVTVISVDPETGERSWHNETRVVHSRGLNDIVADTVDALHAYTTDPLIDPKTQEPFVDKITGEPLRSEVRPNRIVRPVVGGGVFTAAVVGAIYGLNAIQEDAAEFHASLDADTATHGPAIAGEPIGAQPCDMNPMGVEFTCMNGLIVGSVTQSGLDPNNDGVGITNVVVDSSSDYGGGADDLDGSSAVELGPGQTGVVPLTNENGIEVYNINVTMVNPDEYNVSISDPKAQG